MRIASVPTDKSWIETAKRKNPVNILINSSNDITVWKHEL